MKEKRKHKKQTQSPSPPRRKIFGGLEPAPHAERQVEIDRQRLIGVREEIQHAETERLTFPMNGIRIERRKAKKREKKKRLHKMFLRREERKKGERGEKPLVASGVYTPHRSPRKEE